MDIVNPNADFSIIVDCLNMQPFSSCLGRCNREPISLPESGSGKAMLAQKYVEENNE